MTTDTEFKTWDEMTAEEQAEFQLRQAQQSFMRDYSLYSSIIEAIEQNYDTGLSTQDLTELVSSWIYDQREVVADEKEEELKSDPDQTAGEIVADVGSEWTEKEEEDDE